MLYIDIVSVTESESEEAAFVESKWIGVAILCVLSCTSHRTMKNQFLST